MTENINFYGSRKYGSNKYGPSVIEQPKMAVHIDWFKTGEMVNEVAYLSSFSIRRGRQHFLATGGSGFQEESTGKIVVTLENTSGRFSHLNKDSPLYPNIQPGRKIQIVTWTTAGAHRRVTGIIQNIRTFSDSKGRMMVRIEAADLWFILRSAGRSVNVALLENVYADDIINSVLNSIDWEYGRNLDNGQDLYQYWWADSASASKLISDITQAEAGTIWIAGDGTFNYQTRFKNLTAFASLTGANIDIESLDESSPLENVRNVVYCSAVPIYKTEVTTLWEMDGAYLTMTPSGVDQRIEVFGEFSYNLQPVAGTDFVEPVPTTDYEVWSNSDGAGTDLTAQVEINCDFFSSRFRISIRNNSGVMAYVTKLRLRGKALANANAITFIERDETSIYDISEFSLTTKWLQNPNAARQMAKTLLNRLKDPKSPFSFKVVNVDDDTFYQFDLGQRISIDSPELMVHGAYRIIQIEASYDASKSRMDEIKITVEPFPAQLGPGSTLPVTLPFQLGAE